MYQYKTVPSLLILTAAIGLLLGCTDAQETDAAPERRSTRAHSAAVPPVVSTSSTSRT